MPVPELLVLLEPGVPLLLPLGFLLQDSLYFFINIFMLISQLVILLHIILFLTFLAVILICMMLLAAGYRWLSSLRQCLFPPGLRGPLLGLLSQWLKTRLLLPLQYLNLLP